MISLIIHKFVWDNKNMVQYLKSIGLALLLSIGFGTVGSADSLDCSKTSADDEITICDAPENSKPFLINSYDLIRHNLSEITGLSPQCISYEFENASADKADWTLREVHNAQCGGDPNTSPRIAFLKTATWQITNDVSLSIYDMPCGCWLLLD